MGVRIEPVTAARWADFTALFDSTWVRSCSCMWFRVTGAEMKRMWGPGAREAMRQIVAADRVPGLLAYDGDEPVAWVSVGPREEFLPRLERSRLLKPAPGERVWSVLCFFVKPGHRRQGLAALLLDAAVDFARSGGAAAVEGVPVDPGEGRADTGTAFVGVAGMFQAAGFTEIDRRGTRPVYRLFL